MEKAGARKRTARQAKRRIVGFMFVLHSRTRGSLKVGPAMKCIARAANFAGLLAWRVNLARICGPVRGLPATTPGFSVRLWPRQFTVTLTGSAKRFVAVTCAVSIPPYSRASATAFLLASRLIRGPTKCNPIRIARLPEHEVRGDSEGREAR